jgi:hypothetical protein
MNASDQFYYYDRLGTCGLRYLEMLLFLQKWDDEGKAEALYDFICEFQAGVGSKLPIMKLNRWLGYIQGCLIERGYTTVEDERNFTRPLFRPLDFVND